MIDKYYKPSIDEFKRVLEQLDINLNEDLK